jgi:hypothetical protein
MTKRSGVDDLVSEMQNLSMDTPSPSPFQPPLLGSLP